MKNGKNVHRTLNPNFRINLSPIVKTVPTSVEEETRLRLPSIDTRRGATLDRRERKGAVEVTHSPD